MRAPGMPNRLYYNDIVTTEYFMRLTRALPTTQAIHTDLTFPVIPAKAGIHGLSTVHALYHWMPAFAGMTMVNALPAPNICAKRADVQNKDFSFAHNSDLTILFVCCSRFSVRQ